MHPSLAHTKTPPHLAPLIPRSHRPVAVLLPDSGYQPLLIESAPTRVRPALPEGPPHAAPSYGEDRCTDCDEPFVRQSATHRRCAPCARARRKAESLARNKTPQRRAPRTPTPRSVQWQRTRAINQATRERARMGQLGRAAVA